MNNFEIEKLHKRIEKLIMPRLKKLHKEGKLDPKNPPKFNFKINKDGSVTYKDNK